LSAAPWRMMFAKKIGVALALVMVTAAGCGGASSTPAPVKGTIAGTFLAVGGPAPGLHRPVSGVVTLIGPAGRAIDVTVGPKGTFKLQVPEGSYSLSGHSPQFGDGYYLCSGGTIRVRTTSPAIADVVCPVP
jgi:hypothetical protein